MAGDRKLVNKFVERELGRNADTECVQSQLQAFQQGIG